MCFLFRISEDDDGEIVHVGVSIYLTGPTKKKWRSAII